MAKWRWFAALMPGCGSLPSSAMLGGGGGGGSGRGGGITGLRILPPRRGAVSLMASPLGRGASLDCLSTRDVEGISANILGFENLSFVGERCSAAYH